MWRQLMPVRGRRLWVIQVDSPEQLRVEKHPVITMNWVTSQAYRVSIGRVPLQEECSSVRGNMSQYLVPRSVQEDSTPMSDRTMT